MIKTADELGFYACYSVDETWHKDLWVLFAAAARETKNIRFGPNVTHVFLREPTLICTTPGSTRSRGRSRSGSRSRWAR
jgi:5,10-methylenetetrahydromethanopterin reductase